MSRDDLVTTNEKIVGSVTERGRGALARRDPDRRLEPARRDVPRRRRTSRLAQGARLRDGGDPRHGPLLDVHRLGDRRVGEGRDRDGARRPRRPDGAGRLGDDRGRHPADAARLRATASRRWSSARARAAARSSTCSARPRWYAPGAAAAQMVDAVLLDEKRVLPCTAYLEGRVRDRRPLHGRAGEARRGRNRGDRRARARRRRAARL